TNVTRLPDTGPPSLGRPAREDLASAPAVLGQVECDKERMRQWPLEGIGWKANSCGDSGRHWGHPDGRLSWAAVFDAAEKGRGSANEGLVGNEEVGNLSLAERDWCAVGCRSR